MTHAGISTAILGLATAGLALTSACTHHGQNPEAEPTAPLHPVRSGALAGSFNPADPNLIPDVAERVLPAVVSVASTRAAKVESPDLPFDNPFFRHFFGPGLPAPFSTPPGAAPEEHGLGSGVIVGKDLILTNAHVVADAKEIEVTAGDRRSIEAKVLGVDTKSDLAVLRITSDTTGLRSLEFADSSRVRLGQVVLAVGNPFGVGQTVTMGIVSAKGRADLGIEAYEDFIQTDAAINPGNSGGALVDLEGKLVGIPTAILSRSGGYMGVGFAIPSNMAKPIMTSLVEHGRVVRGYLGVGIQSLDAELARALGVPSANGVLISDVKANGPAARAGIQRGDVILSLNGQAVHTTGELRNIVASAGVNAKVKIEFWRANSRKTAEVTLADMPEEPSAKGVGASTPAPTRAGLSVQAIDNVARQRLKIPGDVRGVVVTAVEPGGPAARAGIQPGDVIVQLDRQTIASEDQLSRAWDAAKGGVVAVLVWRDGSTFYATIKH